MKIIVNGENEIVAYAIVGEIESSIDFDGDVPEDFCSTFKPSLYLLLDGSIELNQKYTEPEISDPEPKLTKQDEINAHFYKMELDLKLQLKELKSNG